MVFVDSKSHPRYSPFSRGGDDVHLIDDFVLAITVFRYSADSLRRSSPSLVADVLVLVHRLAFGRTRAQDLT